jgi:hypothetical protein
VEYIHLWADAIPRLRVTVADLYSALGDAQGLRLTNIGAAPYLVLLYDGEQVGVATSAAACDSINAGQRVYQVIIAGQSLDEYLGWLSAPAPWQGFRRCHDLRLAFTE